MANSTQRVRGLIESLSDFWLLYFKDIDQLKVLYEGADTLMGNVYLDLLGSILNASVLDAPLFHKQAFKLVQIRETELRFQKRTSFDQSRYVYKAEDHIVSAQALQNKIFAVTAALEKDVDFYITPARDFEFRFDPLNAYTMTEFGAYDSVVKVRSRDPARRNMRLILEDTGHAPPRIEVSPDATTVSVGYDGPAHTGAVSARQLASAINQHPLAGAVLQAELSTEDGGDRSPAAPGALTLARQAVSPLDGYAVRQIEQMFGGKFTAPRLGSFVARGIEKGDILRLLSAAPHEYVVSAVREDALYLLPGQPLTDLGAASRLDFAVLREPEDNEVLNEPIASSGRLVQGTEDGVIDPVLRRLSSATASFSRLHEGDVVELQGVYNAGAVRILEVIDAHTVALAASGLREEQGVTWSLYSVLDPSSFGSQGEGEAKLFRADRDIFTENVAGTFMMFDALPKPVVMAIERYVSPREVLLAEEFVEPATGLSYGWASHIAAPSRVALPYVDPDSLRVSGRSLRDHTQLVRGRDYLVHADTAQIQPLTVWRTDLDVRVDYQYRTVVTSAAEALLRGTAGSLVAGVFRDESAAFNFYDIGQAIDVEGIGIFFIEEIRSATEVRLAPDSRLLAYTDPSARFLWSLKPRGRLETAGISAFIQEISFWALDALVDKFALYNTFGYLIERFEQSSEAYRALIRGVFQLFMLGPTLERMESAINVVAGLPVIRQDGEVLLAYDRGASQQGTDGVLSADNGIFSADSAEFTDADISSFIFIADGLSENKLYKIVGRVSATEVRVEGLSTDDAPVSWELTRFSEHRLVTTRQTYTLPRTVPVRPLLTQDSAMGTKVFRAFEVLTEAFTVTDSVESPSWWERIQIPEALWPDETAARRQSTPQLVEHIIKPVDEARIGDPGLRIGSDHLGFVPAEGTMPLRHHVAFVVLDSGLKQHLFYVSFNPVMFDKLSPGLIRDLEEFVFVARPAYTYVVLSPSSIFKERVRVEEELLRAMKMRFAGDGEQLQAYASRLRIGAHWKVGSWFRNIFGSGALNMPASDQATVPVLATNPGRTGFVTTVRLDWAGADLTPAPPLPLVLRLFRAHGDGGTGAIDGEDLIADTPSFADSDLGAQLRIGGVVVTLGMIKSPTQVSLGGVLLEEGPVSWERGTYGSGQGAITSWPGATLEATFTDLTATHRFEAGDVGTYVHFLLSDAHGNQGVRIVEVLSDYVCRVELGQALTEKHGPWEHVRDVIRPEGASLAFDLRGIEERPEMASYVVHGFEEPAGPSAVFSAEDGDTPYFIGMHEPRPARFRSRTGLDADLFEYPLQIKRRNV